MVGRPTSINTDSIAREASPSALPDSASHCGSAVRPPSRGAIRDYGREEVVRQQRLSEQVHRLTQLCKPMPDTALSSGRGEPPSHAHYSLGQRRPEPTDLGDTAVVTSSQSRSEETPDTPLAGTARPSTHHVPTATPTRTIPPPCHRQESPPRHGIREVQPPDEEASPSPPRSPGSSTLASQEAEAMLATPPRPPTTARGLCPRDPVPICLQHLQEAAGPTAPTQIPHALLHEARMVDLKIWTFEQMPTPALQRSLVEALTAPARDSTSSPRRWSRHGSASADIVRNFSVAFVGPDLPCSLDSADTSSLAHWARTHVPAPEAALQCLEGILHTPRPAEPGILRSRSPRRSPTLSPYAACRRVGMGTHRIAVYREPGATPPSSPSSSLGSR